MDKIIIDRLQVFANHGVFEEEKINGQNFYISAEMEINASTPGRTDNLNDSVNYAEICTFINDYMKSHTYNLIEAVAENLAKEILLNNTLIKKIKLRVDKPEAPIGLPFDTVAVEIERGWHNAYIAFGSNIGDKEGYIQKALEALQNTQGIKVLKTSSIISTKPYGGVEQDDFLNGCVSIETLLSPDELLDELHRIENEAGRTREIHWGPRTLDLDILLYDEEIIHTENLIIPHIDMQNRLFVLEPLNEIAPYAYNSVINKTASQMYKELSKK